MSLKFGTTKPRLERGVDTSYPIFMGYVIILGVTWIATAMLQHRSMANQSHGKIDASTTTL